MHSYQGGVFSRKHRFLFGEVTRVHTGWPHRHMSKWIHSGACSLYYEVSSCLLNGRHGAGEVGALMLLQRNSRSVSSPHSGSLQNNL